MGLSILEPPVSHRYYYSETGRFPFLFNLSNVVKDELALSQLIRATTYTWGRGRKKPWPTLVFTQSRVGSTGLL